MHMLDKEDRHPLRQQDHVWSCLQGACVTWWSTASERHAARVSDGDVWEQVGDGKEATFTCCTATRTKHKTKIVAIGCDGDMW